MAPNYLNAVIYKLICKTITVLEIYIGSTANEKERNRTHKTSCNNQSEKNKAYNYKVYKFIRENGGWDNWKIEIIEKCPCENKIQMREREQYYCDLLKPELNMIPALTSTLQFE